jgi:hypothetical protein
MRRFLRWLFPAHFSPYAKCASCGRTRLKTEMYDLYLTRGRFCTKEEAEDHWEASQW